MYNRNIVIDLNPLAARIRCFTRVLGPETYIFCRWRIYSVIGFDN